MSYYCSPKAETGLTTSPVQESQRQRLERERKCLSAHIVDVDRALVLLVKHPDIEELINLLRKI